MKLVKSLLLGSAAGLVAVAGASAADLGVKKPSAVEYVKTCPTYGAGFFVVPGTTSCLKLIGRVRADYIFNNDLTRASDKNTFRARGYIGYDHRTATEYGLLRTYFRGFIGRDNAGAYAPVLEYGFIQFGGLTVGRVTPVFEHGWAALFNGSGSFGGFSDIAYVNSIGYTANFGGGFSATIALDSANERKLGLVGGGAAVVGPPAIAAQTYGGQAMPDIVAKLAYDASWGSVFVAGAMHQVRLTHAAAWAAASTKYGYAGTIGAKFNLSMLSKGSNIWFNATMAEGASSYAGFGATTTIGASTVAFSDATLVGAAAGVPGSLKLTRTMALAAGLQAYVSPTVWLGLTGTYAQHDPSGAANTTRTASIWGQAGWTPTAGFLIGAEVGYVNVSGRNSTGAILVGEKSHVVGRLRFQRDF